MDRGITCILIRRIIGSALSWSPGPHFKDIFSFASLFAPPLDHPGCSERMKYWDQLNESWQKVVKLGIVSFVVLFCYIFLFAVDADDNAFLIAGGAIGFVSSV